MRRARSPTPTTVRAMRSDSTGSTGRPTLATGYAAAAESSAESSEQNQGAEAVVEGSGSVSRAGWCSAWSSARSSSSGEGTPLGWNTTGEKARGAGGFGLGVRGRVGARRGGVDRFERRRGFGRGLGRPRGRARADSGVRAGVRAGARVGVASVVAADEDASASYAAGTYALAGRLTAGADASVRAAVGLATRMSPALFA